MIDLHIIQNEKVTIPTIETYRHQFSADNNPFVIFGGSHTNNYLKYENVEKLREDFLGTVQLLKKMKNADRVHIHGLFSFWLLGILALNKRIGKKVVWYIWGDDLYCLTRVKGSFTNKLHLFLRTKACSHIEYIATDIMGDYQRAKKILMRDYKFFELRFTKDFISGILPYVDDEYPHDSINILVGNSATKTNHHIEVFEKLRKYRTENIKVYVPLSYGSNSYAESVISEGKRIFGDKFYPMTKFMEKEQYFRFLMTIDVAIFANDRQQALGNIVALLYAGKKVYMRKNISSWETLREEYEIDISDYSVIEDEDFADFVSNTIDKKRQKYIINEMTDEEKARTAIAASLISETEG